MMMMALTYGMRCGRMFEGLHVLPRVRSEVSVGCEMWCLWHGLHQERQRILWR